MPDTHLITFSERLREARNLPPRPPNNEQTGDTELLDLADAAHPPKRKHWDWFMSVIHNVAKSRCSTATDQETGGQQLKPKNKRCTCLILLSIALGLVTIGSCITVLIIVREDVVNSNAYLVWLIEDKAGQDSRESSHRDTWHDNDEYRERNKDPWADEDDYLRVSHHGEWPDESRDKDDYRVSKGWPMAEDYQDAYDKELYPSEKDSSDSSDHDNSKLYDISADDVIDNKTSSSGVNEKPENDIYPQYADFDDDYFSTFPQVSDDNDQSDKKPHAVEPDFDTQNETRDEQAEYDWKDYNRPDYDPNYNGDFNQLGKASEGDGSDEYGSREDYDYYFGNAEYPDTPSNYDDKLDSPKTTEKPNSDYNPDDAYDWHTLSKDYYGGDTNYDDSYETDYDENALANDTDTDMQDLYEDTDEKKNNADLSSLLDYYGDDGNFEDSYETETDANLQANDTDRHDPYEGTDEKITNTYLSSLLDYYGDDGNFEDNYETYNDVNTQANDTHIHDAYEDIDATKHNSSYLDYNISQPYEALQYPNSDDTYGEYQDDDLQNKQYPGYVDEPQGTIPNYDGDKPSPKPLYSDPYDDSEDYELYPSMTNDDDYDKNNDTMEYSNDKFNYDDYNETDAFQNPSYDGNALENGKVGEIYVDGDDIKLDATNEIDINTVDKGNVLNFNHFRDDTVVEQDEYKNDQNDSNIDPIDYPVDGDEPLNPDSEEQEFNYLYGQREESESQDLGEQIENNNEDRTTAMTALDNKPLDQNSEEQ